MLLVHLNTDWVVIWIFLLSVQVFCLYPSPGTFHKDVEWRGAGLGVGYRAKLCHNGTSHTTQPSASMDKQGSHLVQHEHEWKSGKKTVGARQTQKPSIFSSEGPTSSSGPVGPWGHSFYTSFSHLSSMLQLRDRRSTLTRVNPGHTLPQVQSVPAPSAFGVKFHKCAQLKLDTNPPQLTFFLLIHNMGPVHGSNLSQVAVRDSISGIVPLKSEGREVERGFQTFAIDSLFAGSHVVVNYTAHIRSPKSGVLDLPAFLTFSNASQNDVSMFGPLTANLTLRMNTTDRIFPNHAVHFAGFVGGLFIALVLLLLCFLALNLIDPRSRMRFFHQRRNRGVSDPEYGDCNINETLKDEATFEDKMVDIMVLEDPQNMQQALENLEMSSLLHATNNLEASRLQIYKDVMLALLSRGQSTTRAQQRLLNVLHGQVLGMEGRLKEELGVRMAALAAQCNLETREEMEAEHHREAAEKTQGEQLCQHADQQFILRCSVLLEKLHKLSQNWLQCILLVRHEEASAKVQRQIVELRRVELHKIFCEELEEATRMGEMDKSTAKNLQHDYFICQDQLEEVLDVVLANKRYVLAERHAQRRFLVHSLHSLNSLITDTFSSTSSNLDSWFSHIRRGSSLPAEQIDQLHEKAQKELLMVRQRLDEALSREKRAMRCGLLKKRRELTSDMLRIQKQREKDLSAMSNTLEGCAEIAQHLHCWQNLLTAHSVELSELINNLDEEAATDIRKVIMRVIQGTIAEVKAIQPSVNQSLQALLPPAERSLLQVEPEAAPGQAQGTGVVLQGQERLHQEGQTALHTLRCTRDALREAMAKELNEQRELRNKCRAFFRCLCSSQLTLSEDDWLKMKLEFQKCLSVMDWCLVVPHAVRRAKLHTALAAWRKDHEQQMTNPHAKGKTSEAKNKTDSVELLLFQKRLVDRIQLFEKEKEMESGILNKVLEEMQKEREDYLLFHADRLASEMASMHYQKAERRTKTLEMSRAMLSLHNLLIEQLKQRKPTERQNIAESIQSHCVGLEEAEEQLQAHFNSPDITQPKVDPNKTSQAGSEGVDEKLFEVQQDCRMVAILQEALHKCEQVMAVLAERSRDMTARNQVMEDLKEQIELKRLHANCNQDLDFASQLVMLSEVSAEVVMEILRLLLPTLPESELLSITDALCPKQLPGSSSGEPLGLSETLSQRLSAKLREDMLHKTLIDTPSCTERIQEKRQSLMGKLFRNVCLQAPKTVALLLVKERGKKNNLTNPQQPFSGLTEHSTDETPLDKTLNSSADEYMSISVGTEVDSYAAGERLFVFRDPPASCVNTEVPRRKRKRNFLNFKKSTVVPTNLIP